ncbi:MAG: hypothetical protein ACI4GO_00295 [Hominenteromicrobium sp.]
MMKPKCCANGCFKDHRMCSLCAVSFGLGMVLSCVCPTGLILFLAAVIMVALGIAIIRH